MSIVAVVVFEKGLVKNTFTQDDNDDVIVLDLDNLYRGECPRCERPVDVVYCDNCRLDWSEQHLERTIESLANKWLRDPQGGFDA